MGGEGERHAHPAPLIALEPMVVKRAPTKRAFYMIFRDFNLLNDLGIGYIDPLVSGLGDFSYLPLEKYRFDSAAAEWTETIEPCK